MNLTPLDSAHTPSISSSAAPKPEASSTQKVKRAAPQIHIAAGSSTLRAREIQPAVGTFKVSSLSPGGKKTSAGNSHSPKSACQDIRASYHGRSLLRTSSRLGHQLAASSNPNSPEPVEESKERGRGTHHHSLQLPNGRKPVASSSSPSSLQQPPKGAIRSSQDLELEALLAEIDSDSQKTVLTIQDLNHDFMLSPRAPASPAVAADSLAVSAPIQSVGCKPEDISQMVLSPDIVAIDVPYSSIRDGHVYELVKKMPWLRNISLRHCPHVTDRSVNELAVLQDLEVLDLRDCAGLSGAAFISLPDGSFPKLTQLLLKGTAITDACIAALGKIKTLSVLDISYCEDLTENGLLTLDGLPSLTTVVIRGCKLNPETVQKFSIAHPGITLQGTPIAVVEDPVDDAIGPAACFFLRSCMLFRKNIAGWVHLSELIAHSAEIQQYYERELALRGIEFAWPAGAGPNVWMAVEQLLQRADLPNLSRIMPVLEKRLRENGFFIGYLPTIWEILWELQVNVETMKWITELDLGGKGLTAIPPCLGNLKWRRLERLDLSNNQLTFLPRGFFQFCPSLRGLYLRNNGLIELADEFFQFWPMIAFVDLSHNQIVLLPESSGLQLQKDKVVVINCSFNRISQIEAWMLGDIASLKAMQVQLDVSGNLLTEDQLPALPQNLTIVTSKIGDFSTNT